MAPEQAQNNRPGVTAFGRGDHAGLEPAERNCPDDQEERSRYVVDEWCAGEPGIR